MCVTKTAKATRFLVLMASFLTLFASPSQSAESSKHKVLVAALSVPMETLCMDTKSKDIDDAAIAFTNQSEKDIRLKMGGGQNVTVLGLFGTRTLRPLLSSWMSMSDQSTKGAASDSILRPGETINYQVHFRLAPEVLGQPGFYKVQVSYDATSREALHAETLTDLSGRTNWVILQVHECDNQ